MAVYYIQTFKNLNNETNKQYQVNSYHIAYFTLGIIVLHKG